MGGGALCRDGDEGEEAVMDMGDARQVLLAMAHLDGAYFFKENDLLHICPLSHKDKKHDTFSAACWCRPKVIGNMVIHNKKPPKGQ
jgi:hypothetical protein